MNLWKDADFMYYFRQDAASIFPSKRIDYSYICDWANLTIAPQYSTGDTITIEVSADTLCANIPDDPEKLLLLTIENDQDPLESAHYFLMVLQDYLKDRKTRIITATVEKILSTGIHSLAGLKEPLHNEGCQSLLMQLVYDMQSRGYLAEDVKVKVTVTGNPQRYQTEFLLVFAQNGRSEGYSLILSAAQVLSSRY